MTIFSLKEKKMKVKKIQKGAKQYMLFGFEFSKKDISKISKNEDYIRILINLMDKNVAIVNKDVNISLFRDLEGEYWNIFECSREGLYAIVCID